MTYINICTACGKPFYAAQAGEKRCCECAAHLTQAALTIGMMDEVMSHFNSDLAWAKGEMREKGEVRMMDRCDGPACDMARRLREVGEVAQELHRDNALLIAKHELLVAVVREAVNAIDEDSHPDTASDYTAEKLVDAIVTLRGGGIMTINEWIEERSRAEYIAWHEADWYYTHGNNDAGAECYRQARAIGQQIREVLEAVDELLWPVMLEVEA